MINRKAMILIAGGSILAAASLAACSSSASTPSASNSSPAAASSANPPTDSAAAASPASQGSEVVLPVTANPIVNTGTDPVLTVTFAGVEDLNDPVTGKAIDDRLMLTLKNTGSTPLTDLETYYEMTDVTTGAHEAYYQPLTGVSIPPGQETTVYFDNLTDPGHFPENQFSIFRSSNNEVDFIIQVSSPAAKTATATAVKAVGTGEKVD